MDNIELDDDILSYAKMISEFYKNFRSIELVNENNRLIETQKLLFKCRGFLPSNYVLTHFSASKWIDSLDISLTHVDRTNKIAKYIEYFIGINSISEYLKFKFNKSDDIYLFIHLNKITVIIDTHNYKRIYSFDKTSNKFIIER